MRDLSNELLGNDKVHFIRNICLMSGGSEEDAFDFALNTRLYQGLFEIDLKQVRAKCGDELVGRFTQEINFLKSKLQDIGTSFDIEIDGDRMSILNISGSPDFIEVPQDNITLTKVEVTTSGLATCTALGLRINDVNILAHVSATGTDIQLMCDLISSKLNELLNKSNGEISANCYIWEGDLDPKYRFSYHKAIELLRLLNTRFKLNVAMEQIVYIGDLTLFDKVGIDKNGVPIHRRE